jgi:antirestriction protein ArdC
MASKLDLYSIVTERIVKALEQGLANPNGWECPWNKFAGQAKNTSTGTAYKGINQLLLSIGMAEHGYSKNSWATFNQGKALGWNLKKGSKGEMVLFFQFVTKEKEGVEETFPILKYWNVFNIECFEGVDYEIDDLSGLKDGRIEELDGLLQKGARVSHGGSVAAYSPTQDIVLMPNFESFYSPEGYYSTLIHELAHWTGHSSRLDRNLTGRFGSASYAMEELIAELTSAYGCAENNLKGKLQHADYIANWIKVLKSDKRAIFTASKQAEKAWEYIKA